MIAEELAKLLRRNIEEQVREITAKVNDRQMSAGEAAEFLGITVKTIYNKLSVIPHYKVGKKLRFSQLALEDYIRNGQYSI